MAGRANDQVYACRAIGYSGVTTVLVLSNGNVLFALQAIIPKRLIMPTRNFFALSISLSALGPFPFSQVPLPASALVSAIFCSAVAFIQHNNNRPTLQCKQLFSTNHCRHSPPSRTEWYGYSSKSRRHWLPMDVEMQLSALTRNLNLITLYRVVGSF